MIEFSLKHRIRFPAQKGQGSPTAPKGKFPLVILLHGVGDNEDNFAGLNTYLDERFAVVSLRGPFEQSPRSYGWFRISPFTDERVFFLDDAETSRQKIVKFIQEAVAHYAVDPDHIYLWGFNQGATLCLGVMVTEPALIRGVVAIGGEILPEMLHMRVSKSRLREFPVFLAYGVHDQIMPIIDGRNTRDLLATFTNELSYREYSTGHEVSSRMIQEASAWLSARLDSSRHSSVNAGVPRMQLGHVQLKVRDLDRSIAFYKKTLGLRLTERVGRVYGFLSGSFHHHDLALHAVGTEAMDLSPNSVGVQHIAFEVSDIQVFADACLNLLDAGIQVRVVDHFINWSLYFSDPDGHEIEIYWDTRDMKDRSDLWQGRDLPLTVEKIQAMAQAWSGKSTHEN